MCPDENLHLLASLWTGVAMWLDSCQNTFKALLNRAASSEAGSLVSVLSSLYAQLKCHGYGTRGCSAAEKQTYKWKSCVQRAGGGVETEKLLPESASLRPAFPDCFLVFNLHKGKTNLDV